MRDPAPGEPARQRRTGANGSLGCVDALADDFDNPSVWHGALPQSADEVSRVGMQAVQRHTHSVAQRIPLHCGRGLGCWLGGGRGGEVNLILTVRHPVARHNTRHLVLAARCAAFKFENSHRPRHSGWCLPMGCAHGTAGYGCCKQPKLGRVDLFCCVQLRLERFNLQSRCGIAHAQGFDFLVQFPQDIAACDDAARIRVGAVCHGSILIGHLPPTNAGGSMCVNKWSFGHPGMRRRQSMHSGSQPISMCRSSVASPGQRAMSYGRVILSPPAPSAAP